jgi:hypothetical protein
VSPKSSVLKWIVDRRPTISPVGDQGPRPTCLAWAATAAHEHYVLDPLSVEYLHWAGDSSRNARGTLAGLVSGLSNKGQPPADQWLYDESLDESAPSYNPPPSVTGPFKKSSIRIIDESPDGLINELIEDRLPVATIRVTPAFLAASGGVVDGSDSGTDGHAVAVVGVAETTLAVGTIPIGERLVCVRNSWGPSWGARGFALITETAWAACVIFAVVLEPIAARVC